MARQMARPSAAAIGASPAAYTSVTSNASPVGQHRGEIVEQVARARVAMRLERQHHAAARVSLADRIERGGDLGGVMPVVIDDRDRVAAAVGIV